MESSADESTKLGGVTRRLIRIRVWLSEKVRFSDLQATLLWAAVVGFLGAWTSIGFREGTEWLHQCFTGRQVMEEVVHPPQPGNPLASHSGHGEIGYVESFAAMPQWQRVAVPVLGGLLAGLTLYLGNRLQARTKSTDYMEAVVVGDGNLSVKASLVKSVSAWFSSASGASIGREGPLVQLSSLVASVAGRWMNFPLARKRQLVACGAAAGIASAYNAPVAGAFFVAEIVLGSMAMEAFGPLVISSVVATMTTHAYAGADALYRVGDFTLHSNAELGPYLVLGLFCGAVAPLFLALLKAGEDTFARLKLPVWARLAVGGLIVGLLAMFYPEVTGNGRSLVFDIFDHPSTWQLLAIVLACKLLATTATFGSGAVGGVFTPTLYTGAALGYLFGVAASSLLPSWHMQPSAFALVGMGAFLAAASGAPVMAIIMLFELTLNYQVLMPVMLAGVLAYYVCRSLTSRSLYGEALKRKGAGVVARHLEALKIGDLMKPSSNVLPPTANFGELARAFLQNRDGFLHIVEGGKFLGAVSLHDIKAFLDQPDLESLVIARDVMREDFERLSPSQSMSEALERFGRAEAERLPVTDAAGTLLGTVTKNDVLLFLAGKPRKAETQA
jgi:CIC family chloride channel protein